MQANNPGNKLANTLQAIDKANNEFVPRLHIDETGIILSISEGIVTVSGLPNVEYEEVVKFKNGMHGIAFNIREHEVDIVLLGESSQLQVGDEVGRTGSVMDVPVGEALLGRIIDPLGTALDDKGLIACTTRLPIEREAPAIMDRSAVSTPLQTGLKVIDALIPVGRGQRELILGDRQTGKTAIAIDTIINQKDKDVICVYCAIGQQAASVAKTIAQLTEKGAMEYTTVVVTEGSNPPGMLYIAPYAATSIAEYFMEHGKDVLIVYDDLTNHARAYRELSLLLRRPPGREAFPGDIFYIHSRLLERATALSKELSGGSLTALPIIETEEQDMSAYIPTNLISITDGQIYLSPKLFELGNLPAVDIGKSVSRVGDKAQLPAYSSVTSSLKLAYAQFEELEIFARFGTRLDENTKKVIEHGKRIRESFKQLQLDPMSVPEQMVILLAITNGLLDNTPLVEMQQKETNLRKLANDLPQDIIKHFFANKPLSDRDRSSILKKISEVLEPVDIESKNKNLS